MDFGLNLKHRCHINEDGDGDRFVGIKADSDNAMVYFPIGYQLPECEEDIRQDILQLIAVLSEFTESKDKVLHMQEFGIPQSINLPVNAYMNIIRYYLEQQDYYKEKDIVRKRSDRGRKDWAASLKNNVAFFQEDGTPFFNDYTIVGSTPNEKNLITRIHKYCVYKSFMQLGWLFTSYMPADPHIEEQHEMFLYTLQKKLAVTHNDKDKVLFQSMIAMIEYLDEQTNNKQFYFGTDRFEYVWEKLIDKVFGIPDKVDYFPRTKWTLQYGEKRNNYALEPDTIMLYGNKIYILDAKYYRYGVTGNPKHLPESTSINKQITYGEYIYTQRKFKDKYGDDVPVFNAFLMPFNRASNNFDTNDNFANIGEATGDWKENRHPYERVQGIVIDTRFLMYNYYGSQSSKVLKMAETIDRALVENGKYLTENPIEDD